MNNIKNFHINYSFHALLYLLVLAMPFVIVSIEFSVVLSTTILFILFIERSIKISSKLLNASVLLLLIFLTAFIVHFFYDNTVYDVIKDAVYLIRPFLYLFVGYLLARKLKNKDYVFRGVIYLGVILATVHMLNVALYLIETQNFQVNDLRNANGKDNFLEMLALSLFVLNRKRNLFEIKLQHKKIALFILGLSFVFYFSRTMFVTFIVMLLAVNGYTKLTRRSLMVIFALLLSVLVFYRILYSMDIERGADGIEGFLYKIKIAPEEIFSGEVDIRNASERWDHWRAYEAKMAIEQASDTKYNLGLIFGKGMGSLVDLGFKAQLGKEKLQYIPKIHNGYIYVFFKSGIIGLVLYFLFLVYIYLQAYGLSQSIKVLFINNLLSAIALFYLFTSFIISGIYNSQDVYSIFLGALLFLQLYHKKNT